MPGSDKISRREFITRAAGATVMAGCSIGAGVFFHNRHLVPDKGVSEIVKKFNVPGTEGMMVIVHGNSGAELVNAALAELGGIGRFIKRGDRVLIKPNCAFDRPAYLGATTSPEVVSETVKQCISAGAEVRVIDNPINNAEGSFMKSGLYDAVNKANGKVWLPSPSMFKRTKVGKIKIKTWEVMYEPLAWADKLIGLPTVKSHNLCGVSLAMKNWYGLLGGGRNRLHQSIHDAITDLAIFIKPTLVILDGTRILKSNGPTGGSIADVVPGNVIAAGTDQLAIDVFGASLLGLKVNDIDYLRLASEHGIGETDFNKLKLYKDILV